MNRLRFEKGRAPRIFALVASLLVPIAANTFTAPQAIAQQNAGDMPPLMRLSFTGGFRFKMAAKSAPLTIANVIQGATPKATKRISRKPSARPASRRPDKETISDQTRAIYALATREPDARHQTIVKPTKKPRAPFSRSTRSALGIGPSAGGASHALPEFVVRNQRRTRRIAKQSKSPLNVFNLSAFDFVAITPTITPWLERQGLIPKRSKTHHQASRHAALVQPRRDTHRFRRLWTGRAGTKRRHKTKSRRRYSGNKPIRHPAYLGAWTETTPNWAKSAFGGSSPND